MAAIFTHDTPGVIPGANPNQAAGGAQPPGADPNNVFQFVGGDLARNVGKTAEDLLSGRAFDPARAQGQEALARASQQQRAASSSQFAPALGQGAAVRSQQATERGIFQDVADQQLDFAVQEQAGRERGAQLAVQLEGIGAQKFGRELDAVNLLIANGGETNLAQASARLGEMFPGMEFDFSRQITAENAEDFSTAMSAMANMIASGFTTEQALESLRGQGLSDAINMTDEALGGIYGGMLRATNPMLATLDQIEQGVAAGDFDASTGAALASTYMADLTGMEMAQGADGSWEVVPWDGFTRVTSLANAQPGDQIKFDAPLSTPSGQTVPPGSYVITEETASRTETDGWSGTETTHTSTYRKAVNVDTGEEYWISTESSSDVTEDHSSIGDWLDPLDLFG